MKNYNELHNEAINWLKDIDQPVPRSASHAWVVAAVNFLWDGGWNGFVATQLHDVEVPARLEDYLATRAATL